MLQSIVLAILLTLLTSVVVWYIVIWSYKGLGDLPSPRLLPLIGHLMEFWEITELYTIFGVVQDLQKRFGSLMVVWSLSMVPHVQLSDVSLMEYFLSSVKHITKAKDYKLLEPWLGTGLLTSTGSKWHKRRKILTPAFHFKILEEFTEVINKSGKILVEKLSKVVDRDVDIYPYINLYALDVICETAMGTPINAQTNENTAYLKAVRSYLGIMYSKVFSAWKQFPILFKLFCSDRRKELKDLEVLHNFTKSVIEKRRQELLENRETNSPRKTKLAFLDLLLQTTQDGQPLMDEDIREEVDTFMFEGNDTVSSGISFLLHELSKHEDIQQKIMDEMYEVFGHNTDVEPTIADLQKLNYLELVIKEGLRLYPPVPVIERMLEEDIRIDDAYTNGKRINLPKGTMIVLNAYALHRTEELFPRPENFEPERFRKENLLDKSPFAYVPFSAGPRNCIGQKFAMLEMKATLMKILSNFVLHPVPQHKPKIYSDSVLKSYNGLHVRLVKRI